MGNILIQKAPEISGRYRVKLRELFNGDCLPDLYGGEVSEEIAEYSKEENTWTLNRYENQPEQIDGETLEIREEEVSDPYYYLHILTILEWMPL